MNTNIKRGATLLALSGTALLAAPGTAQAADCGTPAKAATFKTVTTPGTAAEFTTVTVLDQPAVPAVPATYEDIKVIDIEAQPAVPAVYEDVKVVDVAYQPPTEGTPEVLEVSHIEHRLVTEGTPERAEVSHQEYKYSKSVTDYKTQYHFAKFTQTRTKAPNVAGYWQVFSPTYPKTFTGPPSYPTDPRGKWSAKKENGGPQQDASGVFFSGGGNGSWFYRAQPVVSDWSDYGPWTKWSPETHTSWQDSDAPLGSPEFHGSGTYADGTKWERVWQARFDGLTQQVPNGSHTEFYKDGAWTTDTPGAPWVKIDERKVVDVEYQPATPPVYQDVKVIDVEYKPATPGTPEVLEVSHIEHRLVTPEIPAVEEVSHLEHVMVTPASPGSPATYKQVKVLVHAATPATSKKVQVTKAVAATEDCAVPASSERLAFTGSETEALASLALGLLILGGAANGITRRLNRRKNEG